MKCPFVSLPIFTWDRFSSFWVVRNQYMSWIANPFSNSWLAVILSQAVVCLFGSFFILKTFLQKQFKVKLRGSYRYFPLTLSSTPRPPHSSYHQIHGVPIIYIPTRVVHLLQLIKLGLTDHSHPSTQFTPGFILGGVHSLDLEKCMMIYTHHYGIIQSIFTALKILCFSFIPPHTPNPQSFQES